MGERDIHYEFADFAVYPSRLCFFISIMTANINNFGVINFYENNASNQEPKQKAKPVCEEITPVQEEKPTNSSSAIPPDFFCVSARFSEENIRERLDAELSLATTKIEYCRALYRLQHIGCINIQQYASDAQRAIVFNRFQSKFNLSPDDFCRARMNK
jgi:hypothetical protein